MIIKIQFRTCFATTGTSGTLKTSRNTFGHLKLPKLPTLQRVDYCCSCGRSNSTRVMPRGTEGKEMQDSSFRTYQAHHHQLRPQHHHHRHELSGMRWEMIPTCQVAYIFRLFFFFWRCRPNQTYVPISNPPTDACLPLGGPKGNRFYEVRKAISVRRRHY